MALRFINLTPHAVRIWTQGRPDRETVFPASGTTIRIKFSKVAVTSSELVELMVVQPQSITELPAEIARDLRYIVSESVFKFIEDRKDFVYPSTVVRNKLGGVAAYECLACHPVADVKAFFKTHYDQSRPVPAEPESQHA